MNRHQQERQLLEMQADVLRLKIAAAHLRNRREQGGSSLWSDALQLTHQLPVGRLLVAAVAKPRRWRHKLWAAAVVTALAWLKQR